MRNYVITLRKGDGNMIRNIEEQKALGQKAIDKHPRTDLTVGELNQLHDSFIDSFREHGINEAFIKTVEDAFLFGVAVGDRNAKRRVRT